MSTESGPNTRERLLDAAADLAYRDGVGIGVEALCKAAGVSKRSMYQLFPSKDELLAASLERRAAVTGAQLMPADDESEPPRDRILHVFTRLEEQARTAEYRGCPYLAMQVELKDPEHPASRVAGRVKRDLELFFRREAERGGAADPEYVGRQLILVFDGASARAGIRADDMAGLATGTVATLLDAAGVR
ncbi:MAG TPA: TetR/AcrR family transcriptional regulator [Actinospica sp.]|jgi:AcrR family transcriptional regulator|nr:TetR/AcrR family transcriptional regulator [Actinospica sp.]